MINEDLLNKVKHVFSDDVNLLGNFRFDDDELEDIKYEFLDAAKRNANTFDYTLDEISFFVIVVVNKLRDWDKEWSENGFWDQINRVFDDDYYVYLLLKQFLIKLYDAIDVLFRTYNRVLFRTKGNKRAFAQTFLYHALAPRYSLESFIDLAWRKYFDDLECDYPNSDITFCEYVINSLKKKIISPDESADVQFGSTYYKLRTAFKYGVVQNTEKTIRLLDIILLSINKVDRNSEDLEENTINRIISSVVARNKRIIVRTGAGGGTSYRSSNTAHTFGQLKPVLSLEFAQHDKPTIFIRFPRLILLGNENECNYVDVYLYRYNENGEKTLLKQFSRRWFKNNGENSYTLSAFSEELTDVYSSEEKDYHYEFLLISDTGDVYSSKKDFYRDFLLFSQEKEITGNVKPGSYYIVVPKQFDLLNNLHLLGNDYRNLWKNFYNIVPENFDSIDYLGTSILFSQLGMPPNVMFEDQSLTHFDNIVVNKDDIDYEVFISFSNLLIIKDDETNPEHIRVHHIFKDVLGNIVLDEEKRLSELPIINHRYCYEESCNKLSVMGYHSLQVVKFSSSVFGNKILLSKNYLIDRNIVLDESSVPYVDGDSLGRIKLFSKWYDYNISALNEESELKIDELAITVRIQSCFFNWHFGTTPSDVHYSQINLKKPIIVSSFESTNETVVINSAFEIHNVYFRPISTTEQIKVFPGTDINTYLLSQFINSGYKKGYFFCIYNGKELPLFAITDRPYGSENVNLGDCLSLEDNNLKVDIREYFIHDDSNYSVYLTLQNNKGKKIKMKLYTFDDEDVFENVHIDDDEYEANISFAKIYLGEEEPEVSLPPFDVVLGDINKKAFVDVDRIDLRPAKDYVTGTKLKMDGYYIDSISYFGYDDIGDCVFCGLLKSKLTKPQKIMFTHKDGRLISNLQLIYGKDNEVVKKANFDTAKNCFTSNPVSDSVSEFKTIYYK